MSAIYLVLLPREERQGVLTMILNKAKSLGLEGMGGKVDHYITCANCAKLISV